MSQLIKPLEVPIDPQKNPWELNPWLRSMSPFDELYEIDKKGKKLLALITVYHPDNPFSSYSTKEKIEKVTWMKDFTYKDGRIIWNDPIVSKCAYEFPNCCLTPVQRAFRDEQETLKKRVQFLSDTEWDLESARVLNSIQKDSLKVYESYENIQNKFLSEKAKGKGVGGVLLTPREQKKI